MCGKHAAESQLLTGYHSLFSQPQLSAHYPTGIMTKETVRKTFTEEEFKNCQLIGSDSHVPQRAGDPWCLVSEEKYRWSGSVNDRPENLVCLLFQESCPMFLQGTECKQSRRLFVAGKRTWVMEPPVWITYSCLLKINEHTTPQEKASRIRILRFLFIS